MGARLYPFIFAIFAIQGCVTVENNNAKTLNVGVLSISNERSNGSRTEERSVLGLWVSKHSAGLGYRKDSKVILDSDCQVIFVTDETDKFEAAIRLLNSTLDLNGGQICTIKKKPN